MKNMVEVDTTKENNRLKEIYVKTGLTSQDFYYLDFANNIIRTYNLIKNSGHSVLFWISLKGTIRHILSPRLGFYYGRELKEPEVEFLTFPPPFFLPTTKKFSSV